MNMCHILTAIMAFTFACRCASADAIKAGGQKEKYVVFCENTEQYYAVDDKTINLDALLQDKGLVRESSRGVFDDGTPYYCTNRNPDEGAFIECDASGSFRVVGTFSGDSKDTSVKATYPDYERYSDVVACGVKITDMPMTEIWILVKTFYFMNTLQPELQTA